MSMAAHAVAVCCEYPLSVRVAEHNIANRLNASYHLDQNNTHVIRRSQVERTSFLDVVCDLAVDRFPELIRPGDRFLALGYYEGVHEYCVIGEHLVHNSFHIRQRSRYKQRFADVKDLLLWGLHTCLTRKAGLCRGVQACV